MADNVSGSYTNLANTGIYSGTTSGTLNISNVSGLDSTYYRCIISNANCSIISNAALLRALISPDITLQPKPVAVCSGSSTSFSVVANGGVIAYQWQSDSSGTFEDLNNAGVYSNVNTATLNVSRLRRYEWDIISVYCNGM